MRRPSHPSARIFSLLAAPAPILVVPLLVASALAAPAWADAGAAGGPRGDAWAAALFHSPSLPPTARPSPAPPFAISRPPWPPVFSPAPVPAPAASALPAGPFQACRAAVAAAERAGNIPPHLLAAIARVETGRADGAGGESPWPWSLNVEGVDHVYASKAEAMAAVTAFQANGVRSIDVGCLQVNLMYHPDAFHSLAEALDPVANANYAARFLGELFAKTGSWERATAMYHSGDPALGGPYQRKVAAVLPDEQRRDDSVLAPGALVASLGASPGAGSGGAFGSIGGALRVGMGASMLGMRPAPPRMLAQAPGMGGRSLDSYRLSPIQIPRAMPRPLVTPG